MSWPDDASLHVARSASQPRKGKAWLGTSLLEFLKLQVWSSWAHPLMPLHTASTEYLFEKRRLATLHLVVRRHFEMKGWYFYDRVAMHLSSAGDCLIMDFGTPTIRGL